MNVLELLTNQMSRSNVKQLSSVLGASELQTQSALSALLPSLLGTLLAGSQSQGGAGKLLQYISQQESSGRLVENIGEIMKGDMVSSLLNSDNSPLKALLGNKAGILPELIAQSTGMKGSSIWSLMKLLIPALLFWISRSVRSSANPTAALISLAEKQLPALQGKIPSNIMNGLGLSEEIRKLQRPEKDAHMHAPVEKSRNSWAVPLLALALLAGLWWWNRPDPRSVERSAEMAGQTDARMEQGEYVADAESIRARADFEKMINRYSVILPDGQTLEVSKGSALDHLLALLKSSEELIETPLPLEAVNFEPASARLTSDSTEELADLRSILKAYPQSKITVHGYTDKTGDAQANKELSLARAESVKSFLIADGIASSRIHTVGHGEADAVASNLSETGRAANRRIEITLTNRG